jgi:hypothetical protein
MINFRTIARELTHFIRQSSPLTVEEMCPITLSILCYRFAAYDVALATDGREDPWKELVCNMGSEAIEPKYALQSTLLTAGTLFGDKEVYEVFDRVTQVMSRLPKGDFCAEYVRRIDVLTKDYSAPGRRTGLFNYIMRLHGGRYIETVPMEVGSLVGLLLRRTLIRQNGMQLYDPACGVASLALMAWARNSGKFDGMVLREPTTLQADMARLSMYVNGISQYDLKNEDYLRDDWMPTERYDVIVSMPAWGQRRRIDAPMRGGLPLRYPKLAEVPYDYACILRGLESLKDDGMMIMAMPMGVLQQTGFGEAVRREIIAHNDLRAVIGMPVNMLYSTSVAFALLVFKHSDSRKDVLMINAKSLYEGHGRLNKMRAIDQQRIVHAFTGNRTIDGLSRVVSHDEIALNNFNLLPSHYVSDPMAQQRNIAEKIREINELTAQMRALTREHNEYLRQLGLPELEV